VRESVDVYARILVATDGSETATRAVDRAVKVAQATGGTLTLLTAAPSVQADAILAREQQRLAGAGVDIETRSSDRDAASAIVEAAEGGDYDLVVVGNKGMTGSKRFFTLGSVPNKVSHHLATNLLIVRTT
jgi:nucleotide-binding universal stress UspA family protein